MQPPPQVVLFDVGDTLLELDLGAMVEVIGHGVDIDRLTQGIVATRRRLDAWYLPHLKAKRYPSVEEFEGGRPLPDLTLELLGLKASQRGPVLGHLAALDSKYRLWSRVTHGARAALVGLQAREIRMGVISNSDGTVRAKLKRAGLARFFPLILDSAVEGLAKPNPKIFKLALQRLGVEPSKALYVGDTYSLDALPAQHAGMSTMLYDPHGLYVDKDVKRIDRLDVLLDLFLSPDLTAKGAKIAKEDLSSLAILAPLAVKSGV